jgi:hypothetical protein
MTTQPKREAGACACPDRCGCTYPAEPGATMCWYCEAMQPEPDEWGDVVISLPVREVRSGRKRGADNA